MTLRYVSGLNGFIPEATGQVIAFIRSPERFALNQYVQYIPAPKSLFLWYEIGRDEAVRVVADADYAWEDGDERPSGEAGIKVPHQIQSGTTFRRDYPWQLGYKAIEQSGPSWKPKPVHMANATSVAMTNRTVRVMSLLETTSNWPVGHVQSADTLNGGRGKWDLASDDPNSPNYNAIWETLVTGMEQIHLDTNGVIRFEDYRWVMSPTAAKRIAATAELNNYLRESPDAKAQVTGESSNWNKRWGLPTHYKGLQICVEDAVRVNERRKASGVEATTNRSYVKSADSTLLLSRPGGLDGEYGAPSFSTVQLYHFGGLLETEAFDEPKHRRVEGHVSEDIDEVLAAGVAGMLITDCFED